MDGFKVGAAYQKDKAKTRKLQFPADPREQIGLEINY